MINPSEQRQRINQAAYEKHRAHYPHELWVSWNRSQDADMKPVYLDQLRQRGAFTDHFVRLPFPKMGEVVYMFTNEEDLKYFMTLVENKHTP